MSSAKNDTAAEPTGPTAQQKRDMSAVARAEGILRVPSTPYVVLSFDGPVDIARLANALGAPSAGQVPSGLLTGTATINGEQREAATFAGMVWAENEGAPTAVDAVGNAQPAALEDDDDGGVDDDGEPEEEPADPTERVHTHLLEHGPSNPQAIAQALGMTRTQAGAAIVRLMTAGRVEKSGLSYATVGQRT